MDDRKRHTYNREVYGCDGGFRHDGVACRDKDTRNPWVQRLASRAPKLRDGGLADDDCTQADEEMLSRVSGKAYQSLVHNPIQESSESGGNAEADDDGDDRRQ